MNKKEKNQRIGAINIESNSASYYPILTAITTQIIIIKSTKKNRFVV